MSRIPTPESAEAAPAGSRELLNAVEAKLGSVPNLFRIIANSPAALEGYLGLAGALDKGEVDAKTRERIALAVAQVNGCDYCLAAHSYIGGKLAGLPKADIAASRKGTSTDARAAAAVAFAAGIARNRGQVDDAGIAAVRAQGYSDAAIVEMVVLVALNLLTNYVNTALKTEIDFPQADLLAA